MNERKWTPCAAQSAEYHAGYNQALIDTAALDLYEALELVLDAIGALSKPHELYGWGLDKDDIDSIFTTLAKARGK